MLPPRILFGAGLALALGLPSLCALIDRNGDGLSDGWAALYLPKGAVVAAGADTDGDGATNLQESVAGTDPLNAASRFAATPHTDAAGNLVLRWRGAWGKRYTIESSIDLKTWTALPDLHVGRGQELSSVVHAAGTALEARRYWRVVVADIDSDADGMTNAEEIELGSDPTMDDATLGRPRTYGAECFVSPTGSDANAGTKAAPFLTLEKAKAAVRARITAGLPAGGIAVWLRGGIYERASGLTLGSLDSGTSAADSVDWRGWPGEEVRLVGGRRLPASAFSVVTSASPIWARLDESARGQVLECDLPAQGITDYGTLRPRGIGLDAIAALELFVDAEPMRLARWPDVGTTEMTVPDPTGETFTVYGTATPGVAGTYTRYATLDGVSAFRRDGLVAGDLQYYLRRYSYPNATGGRNVVWFITTVATDTWPNGAAGSTWQCWAAEPTTFAPPAALPSAGTLFALDPARLNNGYAHTTSPITTTSFCYTGDRPTRWLHAPDAWVDGFWCWTWAEFHLPVAGIDTASRTLSVQHAPAKYGLKAGTPWYVYNLLEEITQPGEWYLDRTTGRLYLWPPAGFAAGTDVVVSLLEASLWNLDHARHVTLRDLVVEGGRRTQVSLWECNDVVLHGLVLRNSGGGAVSMSGYAASAATRNRDNVLRRSRIAGTGHTAVWITGGERSSITPGGNRVEDCELHDYARFQLSGVSGVSLRGCGQIVRHNRFHHAPREAVAFRGNEQLIEANDIREVCLESADGGAIYGDDDWGARGTMVRHNLIRQVHNRFRSDDVHGIYLDETIAGVGVVGNLIYGVDGYGIKVNGGRDHSLRGNLIARSGGALTAADWGLYELRTQEWLLQTRHAALAALGYRSEPWLSRYPACAAIPDTWAAVKAEADTWLAPRGCEFTGNLVWQARKPWIDGEPIVERYFERGAAVAIENFSDMDPLFVDEAGGDLRLRPESPAFGISGWTEFPFERIGVRE